MKSFQKALNQTKINESYSLRLLKQRNHQHIGKRKLTDILGPTLGKLGEVEVTHRRSIHLENKKLLAPLLVAIRDVLDDVATWARRHEESTRVLLIPLYQNELTKLAKTKSKTLLPSLNQDGDKMPKKIREKLGKR